MSIIYDPPEIWNVADTATIWMASEIVDVALEPYTDLRGGGAFSAVFGSVRFRFNNGLKTWAHANSSGIIFLRGYVILPLVIHELGHRFNIKLKLRPQKQLWKDKIDPRKGSLWGGFHTRTMADGNEPDEWFANLFADWAMQMLARNAEGDKLRAWMDEHMPAWVAAAMEVAA